MFVADSDFSRTEPLFVYWRFFKCVHVCFSIHRHIVIIFIIVIIRKYFFHTDRGVQNVCTMHQY